MYNMRKNIFFAFVIGIFFISCSNKNFDAPSQENIISETSKVISGDVNMRDQTRNSSLRTPVTGWSFTLTQLGNVRSHKFQATGNYYVIGCYHDDPKDAVQLRVAEIDQFGTEYWVAHESIKSGQNFTKTYEAQYDFRIIRVQVISSGHRRVTGYLNCGSSYK